jgi:hypothetical protein
MPPKPKTSANPWKRGLVIAAILAAGAFAFPGGMVDWLDERNASGWLGAPLAVARGVDAVSGAVGVKQAGQALRRAFAAWVGADEG